MDPCCHPCTGLHKAGAVAPAQAPSNTVLFATSSDPGGNAAPGGGEGLLTPPLQGGDDAPALTPALHQTFGHQTFGHHLDICPWKIKI